MQTTRTVPIELKITEPIIYVGTVLARTKDDVITVIGSMSTLQFNVKNADGKIINIECSIVDLMKAAHAMVNSSD